MSFVQVHNYRINRRIIVVLIMLLDVSQTYSSETVPTPLRVASNMADFGISSNFCNSKSLAYDAVRSRRVPQKSQLHRHSLYIGENNVLNILVIILKKLTENSIVRNRV